MLMDNYPTIKKAIIELAYDNGVVNRLETEEEVLKRLDILVRCYEDSELEKWENILSSLEEEVFIDYVVNGMLPAVNLDWVLSSEDMENFLDAIAEAL